MVLPRVRFRIIVPADIKLSDLHSVIRTLTNAPDTGQYFFIDGRRTVFADPAFRDLDRVKPVRHVGLDDILSNSDYRLRYFSGDDDSWEHDIELMNVTQNGRRLNRATCLAASRQMRGNITRRRGRGVLARVNRALRRIKV